MKRGKDINEPGAKQGLESANITLTLAITAHAEGRLLRPTLRSIAAAISELLAESVTCELLIVLDNATADTVREAQRWQEPGWLEVPVRLVHESNGDAGASRNAAVREASGMYIAMCDGDDLVSRNYFTEALRILRSEKKPLIIHPGTVVSFGARTAIWTVVSTDDVNHLDLIRNNLWPSSSVSLRSVYTQIPYVSIPLASGLGPEDWLWNIETSIAGIPHRAATTTMFFYRVRESGGVNNRHLSSILPPFDLQGLIAALPVRDTSNSGHPSANRRRRTIRALGRRGYLLARPAIRKVTASLSQGTRERLYAGAREVLSRTPRAHRVAKASHVVPPAVLSALLEAAEIEPSMSWPANGYTRLPHWIPRSDVYASLLVQLVGQLRDKADALVAVPWVGIGGADLVSLNYARALLATPKFGGKVTMLATHTPSRTHPHLIPDGVRLVQVPVSFRTLTPDLQRRLLAQVLLLVRPQLVVSVNCFDMTNSLQLFGHQMAEATPIYLTLFAFDRIGAGFPVNPITDDSQRQYLDEIGGVLTDNSVTAGLIEEILALHETRVTVHHQPAMDSTPELRMGTRAYNDQYFSDANPFKLLWPHRLDKEKRPDVLVRLAHALKASGLPVQINVYGQQVLSTNGKELMASLKKAGVEYHGPYSGGLPALPTFDYHALLLTSESEGLPLVLVQSMLLGLPVISTAVGGVVDLVKDRDTGILVDGPDDIDGFVAGIRLLFDSLEERRRIIRSAYTFALAQHGWAAFTQLVEALG